MPTWLEVRFLRKSLSWIASLMRFLVWKSLSTVVMVRAALLDTLCPDTPCFLLRASCPATLWLSWARGHRLGAD